MSEKKKIAAIVTEYRPRSHADVIVTKFLHGFPTDSDFFLSGLARAVQRVAYSTAPTGWLSSLCAAYSHASSPPGR